MNNENKFINSGDDTTEQKLENLKNNNIEAQKPTNKQQNVQNLINKGGSLALQKLGVPKGLANKALQKGLPMDKLPANNLIKNKAIQQIANSPVGNILGGNETTEQQNNSNGSFSSNVSSQVKNIVLGKNKFAFAGILSIAIIIFFIIMVVVVYTNEEDELSIRYFSSLMDGDVEESEKLYGYVSKCKSKDDEECNAKVDFYEYVNHKFYEYRTEYSVEVNRVLVIATLTYSNPYLTEPPETDEEGEELSSTLKYYKKSKKQVDKLFMNMIREVKPSCYVTGDGGSVSEIDCDKQNGDQEVTVKRKFVLDEEQYRRYLENSFVIKYYLDGDKSPSGKENALQIVEEIYEQYDEYMEYLGKKRDNNPAYISNKVEIMVNITDCNGTTVLEEMTLSKYLEGVVYTYSDNDSDNYFKFLAVAAKNNLYSINNAKPDNMPMNLRVRNCKANQIYCDVAEGCHYTEDENSTVVSGNDNNLLKGPASAEQLAKIKTAVELTKNDFVTNNGSIVKTDLGNLNKSQIVIKLYNDTYKNVLASTYGGSVESVTLYTKGYPLDLINNEVTSAYGWRFDPIHLECRHHNGTDIAGNAGDNIYAIANGVVVVNEFNSSYGNYTVIGHGKFEDGQYEYYSLYAHQNRLSTKVTVGRKVEAGQAIGNVGSTGWSTGAHLHIEIYTLENGNKKRTDPVSYFKDVDLIGKVGGALYDSEQSCKAANPYL